MQYCGYDRSKYGYGPISCILCFFCGYWCAICCPCDPIRQVTPELAAGDQAHLLAPAQAEAAAYACPSTMYPC